MSEKEGYSISNKWTFTANYGWVLLLSHPGKDDVIRILRWSDRVEMTLPRYLLRPAADTEDNQAAFQRLDAEFEQWDVQRRKDEAIEVEQRAKFAAQVEAQRRAEAERVEAQRRAEAEARLEFQRLKEKYEVAWYRETSPVSPLYPILMDLVTGNKFSEGIEQWLKKEKLFAVLALYYEQDGKFATAGSFWRKAEDPSRALRVSEGKRPASSILCMRGGAYRDLGELDPAETCGVQAISLSPTEYHPYNLLGAIYYQRGLPEQGDIFLQKARELGSKSNEDAEIRSAFKKAGKDEQRHVAEYLLKKDPERYVWAKHYL